MHFIEPRMILSDTVCQVSDRQSASFIAFQGNCNYTLPPDNFPFCLFVCFCLVYFDVSVTIISFSAYLVFYLKLKKKKKAFAWGLSMVSMGTAYKHW